MDPTKPAAEKKSRYVRQSLFTPLGEEGQQRIQESRVLICGCGALGSVLANTLARAGVGHLRIVDRDFLELNNLQRQVLYDEEDVRSHLPKAIAAAARLRKINSSISIEPVVADVNHSNVGGLLKDVDAIADGTDNFETRFLLNDAAHYYRIPWVYGGCIGSEGQTLTIVPGQTGCLRCLMTDVPPPGTTATCDTAGILGPIVNIVASFQAAEILKLISGNLEAINTKLSVIDVWGNRLRQIGLGAIRSPDCLTCGSGDYEWLEGKRGSSVAVLCGRNAVQLTFPDRQDVDLDSLAAKLQSLGNVEKNPFLLRVEIEGHAVTIFADGRAVIGGTNDQATARSIYSRYIGN